MNNDPKSWETICGPLMDIFPFGMAHCVLIDLAVIPTKMMENIWCFTQVGGKILYVRNHQLTKEVSSEKNNFFSLLVKDSKIVHSFW